MIFSPAPMPRQSTLATREAQLIALKLEAATLRDKATRLGQLGHQITLAEQQNFPKSAIEALQQEVKRVEGLGDDPKLAEKIDVLERWISAEKSYQKLFPRAAASRPRKAAGATGTTGAKRGRPRKVKA